ncbi:Nn.00g047250.m01.CDS01 [Neocucurbitaria sp. VM-36]
MKHTQASTGTSRPPTPPPPRSFIHRTSWSESRSVTPDPDLPLWDTGLPQGAYQAMADKASTQTKQSPSSPPKSQHAYGEYCKGIHRPQPQSPPPNPSSLSSPSSSSTKPRHRSWPRIARPVLSPASTDHRIEEGACRTQTRQITDATAEAANSSHRDTSRIPEKVDINASAPMDRRISHSPTTESYTWNSDKAIYDTMANLDPGWMMPLGSTTRSTSSKAPRPKDTMKTDNNTDYLASWFSKLIIPKTTPPLPIKYGQIPVIEGLDPETALQNKKLPFRPKVAESGASKQVYPRREMQRDLMEKVLVDVEAEKNVSIKKEESDEVSVCSDEEAEWEQVTGDEDWEIIKR